MTARRRPRPEAPTRPQEFLGPHRLKDAEFRAAVGAVDFAVKARYAWDTGVAVSHYLRGLKRGQILARMCRQCRRVLVPPRMFCEQCFRPTDRWMQVQDTGVVNTFSLCYVSWDMRPLEIPEIPAVIEIDGASSGIGFMHKLGDVEPDQVHVGMAVEAVWKAEPEREGSILDIRYFRPREAALRQSTTSSSAAPGRPAATRKRKR